MLDIPPVWAYNPYKEPIATWVASLNNCEYSVSAHRYLARQRGATAEQVECYGKFEAGPFTRKERRASGMRGCRMFPNTIDDAAFDAVSAHFNAQELIELTAVAAAFEFFPRFNSALRIPVTPLREQNTELVLEAVED